MALEIPGFRREQGLLWPNYDRRCAQVTFRETGENIALIRARVPNYRVAVQAGGNCGQLVRPMSELFEAIYTFEPDLQNFVALTVNTADRANVYRFQAGLGNAEDRGDLKGMAQGDRAHADNCGAYYISGSGHIPMLAIDDLALSDVDLIMLDIEGAELNALQGAADTIRRCQPIIVFEEKGLGERHYGNAVDAAERYLAETHGYIRLERRKIDVVMGPK